MEPSTPLVEKVNIQEEVLQESTQTPSTQLTIYKTESFPTLVSHFEELNKELQNSKVVVKEEVKTGFEVLKEQLRNYQELEALEDEKQTKMIEDLYNLEVQYQEKSKALAKEQGTKAFAKLNAVLGFDNDQLTYGIGGALGLRLGKGFMLETGANYMLGKFNELPSLKPNLDNLTMTVGIGWEW